MKYIEVGDRVVIQPGLWALALKIDNNEPILNIGNNVYIGRFLHIVSVRRVVIKRMFSSPIRYIYQTTFMSIKIFIFQ